MMTDMDKSWYNQPCFDRYWKSYGNTFNWYQHHRNKWSMENQPGLGNLNYNIEDTSTSNEDAFISSNPEDTQDSSEEVVQVEMEITEELIAFFEQSEYHRKQLQVRRQEIRKKKKEDIAKANMEPAASWSHSGNCSLPSHVFTSANRSNEMKYLYGKSAAIIHGMETSTQLNFDRYCDIHQPKLWPVIPLNL